ncbi:hypothetical protein ACWDZX_03595, partial [Streptomyces collinus]
WRPTAPTPGAESPRAASAKPRPGGEPASGASGGDAGPAADAEAHEKAFPEPRTGEEASADEESVPEHKEDSVR